MKIIDLLNKIANGEEVPYKIKVKDYFILTRTKCDNFLKYYIDEDGGFLFANYSYELNDEVEIIEEEPRDIEICGSWFTKSEYDKLAHCEEEKKIPENLPFKNDMKLTIMEVYHELEKYNYKINEIIDYLKSKGE